MQDPGLLRTLSLNSLSHDEQTIINNLAKTWFITFTRTTSFKDDRFTFLFAKPTDKIIERFHLSREVLIVFSDKKNFLPRSLDFVDKTISEFQNRLDKLCVIIISNDNSVKTKVKNITIQDKEARIIIPFTYEELLEYNFDTTKQLVRLKDHFYERDLFAYDSPLRNDTYFFGRQATIQHLYGKYQSGQCGCLFGLRRIGKTSVLLAVQRYMNLRNEPSIYIDCSETGFHQKRWFEVLHFTINEIRKKYDPENNLSLNQVDSYTEKEASTKFEEDLSKIRSNFENNRILLIFDEIESITFELSPSNPWKSDLDFIFFWQTLRSIFQKNPNLFSFIIVGVNPKSIETPIISGYDNPIYRFMTPFFLPFFETKEVKEMVSSIGSYMGINFDEEVYTYLTDDFGGHPFIIRQVCSKLFNKLGNNRPGNITKFMYQQESENLSKSITDYIELIITVLKERYVEEYELLQYLAQGDQETFSEFATLSHKMIEHLIGYGLIKEEANKYYFRIKEVEKYLIKVTIINKIPTTKEEKWQKISSQRNTLEQNLRKLIKSNLKLKYGPIKAKEMFLSIVSPPSRKAQLESIDYNSIFNYHLYFEDLRKVIEKYWSDFELIFNKDKGKFRSHMEFVNQNRADAHANEIEDETLVSQRLTE